MRNNKTFSTRNIVTIGMLSAVSAVLMCLQISVPFVPVFYKLDFADVPIMIGSFAIGPVAGVFISFLKVLIKVVLQGTTTMYVGDLASFMGGATIALISGFLYRRNHTKQGAIRALVGTGIGNVLWAVFCNTCITLPFYAAVTFKDAGGMDMLIGMGTAVNSHITNLFTFVLFAIVPFNIVKITLQCIVTFAVYKRTSNIIHSYGSVRKAKKVSDEV